MKISNELRERVERAFQNNESLKNQLLAGNADAIKSVGELSGKGITPEAVIVAHKNNNMDYIYQQARKMIECRKIYEELCEAYMKSYVEER